MKRMMKFLGTAISALVLCVLAAGLALNADVRGKFGDMRGLGQTPAMSKATTEEVVQGGEYTGKNDVAAYIRKFNGSLPKNYITKAQARALGWRGGPVEPYASG